MSEIRDLSVLSGRPREVQLLEDGPVYKLPADVPIPVVLTIEQAGQTIQDSADDEAKSQAIRDLYAELLRQFQVYQPDLGSVPLSLTQMLTYIPMVYGDGLEQIQPEEGGAGPTAPKTKPSASRKARSTSSRSSRG